MKAIRIASLVLVLFGCCAALSGCTITATVSLKCVIQMSLKCSPSGELKAIQPFNLQQVGSASGFAQATQSLDASQFYISTVGSTIAYPATGQVAISLLDSSSGTLLAAKVFDWIRNGTVIVLQNPIAVNQWAASAAPSADALSYQMLPFAVATRPGDNVVAQTSYYQGSKLASAETHIVCTSGPPTPSKPIPCDL